MIFINPLYGNNITIYALFMEFTIPNYHYFVVMSSERLPAWKKRGKNKGGKQRGQVHLEP
jgi:hypothetical protein